MKSKQELRNIFPKALLENAYRENATTDIIKNIESFIGGKRGPIGIYFSMGDEIDILPIMIKFPTLQFALPKIIEDDMCFVKYSFGHRLENNSEYPSIMEPKALNEVVPSTVIVPGLAYDLKGYRLGRGKGHYDKYFAKHGGDITKVGISFNQNIIESLPRESHDCNMDFLISEDLLIKTS